MLTIRCPGCQRRLNLPEELRGAAVQCPSCATSFLAPGDSVPLHSALVPSTEVQTESAPAIREQDQETSSYLTGRRVKRAAYWLGRGVFFDWIANGLSCPCLFVLAETGRRVDSGTLVILILGFVALILLGGLVLIGADYLKRRRLYGFAFATGILGLLLGLKNIVQTGVLLFAVVDRRHLDGCLALLVILLLVLSGAAVVSLLTGGVQTLHALLDPQVRRDFQ